MTEIRKECFKCHKMLSLSEFYRHSRMADGHLNKCKECTKLDTFNDRHFNRVERIRAYDRERAKDPERKAMSDKIRKRYEKKHPGRKLVNGRLVKAIKAGLVVKPDVCQICGAPNPVSHHHDYNKPFDVLWVCNSCHRNIHIQIDRGELPAVIERPHKVKHVVLTRTGK